MGSLWEINRFTFCHNTYLNPTPFPKNTAKPIYALLFLLFVDFGPTPTFCQIAKHYFMSQQGNTKSHYPIVQNLLSGGSLTNSHFQIFTKLITNYVFVRGGPPKKKHWKIRNSPFLAYVFFNRHFRLFDFFDPTFWVWRMIIFLMCVSCIPSYNALWCCLLLPLVSHPSGLELLLVLCQIFIFFQTMGHCLLFLVMLVAPNCIK